MKIAGVTRIQPTIAAAHKPQQPASSPANRRAASKRQLLTPKTENLLIPNSFPAASVAEPRTDIHEKNEFRRGVGICVVNREGLVFAAKRMDDVQNTWQMPQGGIDPYENPLVAALRELHEETGMTSVHIISSIDRWLEYEMATKVRCQMTGDWVRYRGQTQKWLLLHFHGADAEIDLSSHGPPEFSEWRWMKLQDLPHAVVDFKQGVYHAVASHFGPRINHLCNK